MSQDEQNNASINKIAILKLLSISSDLIKSQKINSYKTGNPRSRILEFV